MDQCQAPQGGGAFVDTAQLDGESSLKPKHAVDETQHMIRNSSVHSVEGCLSAVAVVWCRWRILNIFEGSVLIS